MLLFRCRAHGINAPVAPKSIEKIPHINWKGKVTGMNTLLKQRIEEKLERFSPQRVAEVLDFVEFLETKERHSTAFRSDARDDRTYLVGIEDTLSEWSGEADERAYRDL